MPTWQSQNVGRYDRSLIITVAADATIRANARNVRTRIGKSATVVHISLKMLQGTGRFARAELKESLSQLTRHSRVYLYGHGAWQEQTLGGASADELVRALTDMPAVKTVSLICCDAAIDGSQGEKGLRVALSANSLASDLHDKLRKQGKAVTLYARTMLMGVRPSGHKVTGTAIDSSTKGLADPKWRSPFTKVVFDWDGDKQRRRWYDYTAKAPGALLFDPPAATPFPGLTQVTPDLLAAFDEACTF